MCYLQGRDKGKNFIDSFWTSVCNHTYLQFKNVKSGTLHNIKELGN